MKKGAWIKVAVWVEGEDVAGHDFGKTALEAVKNSVKLVVPNQYQNLKLDVRSVWEDDEAPPAAAAGAGK